MKDVGIASYADRNTPYIVGDSIYQVISALHNAAASLFKWLSDIQMKANPDKWHILINGSCKKKIKIAGHIIESNECKKLH